MQTRPARRPPSPVGAVLQQWRAQRRLSQLDLSVATGVTARHISFVETGRSSPSRRLLESLADGLDMPLRDRNALHLAAGFAAPYQDHDLGDEDLALVETAIDRILSAHEPYPAVVMDRHWDLVRSNDAAQRFFASLLGTGARQTPLNVLRLIFDPDGLRPHVANWSALAPALLARARREAVGAVPDPALQALLDELGTLVTDDVAPAPSAGPLVEVVFAVDDERLRYFSTVTTLGTALDVTLQELRIECFHPADETTRAAAARLAAGPG